MKAALSVAVLGVLMFSTIASAQDASRPRLSLATTIGPAQVPNAIAEKCSSRSGGGTFGFDASGTLIARPWKLLVAQIDARGTQKLSSDCVARGAETDTLYLDSAYKTRAMSSSARLGVETPVSMPLLRLTVGRGMLWRGSESRTISLEGPSPEPPGRQKFWVVGAAIGTRGRRHVLLEVDRMNMRVDAYESRYTTAPNGDVSANSRDIHVSPSWWSVRLGIEWALSAERP